MKYFAIYSTPRLGSYIIDADSKEEAKEIASQINDSNINWSSEFYGSVKLIEITDEDIKTYDELQSYYKKIKKETEL